MIGAAEIKVGALVLIALVLLGAVTYYVLHRAESGMHYAIYVVFDEAVVEKGDRVRLAGIDVGFVEGLELTPQQRARVRLMIRRGVAIYPDYEVTMNSSAMFGGRYVEMTPSRPSRAKRPLRREREMQGTVKPGLEDLVSAADTLIASLQQTTASVSDLLGDESIAGSLRRALQTADEVMLKANTAVEQLTAMAAANQPRVEELVGNLVQASEALVGLAEEMVPQIEEAALPEHVGEAARSLRNTAAAMEDTAEGVRELFQDPALRDSLGEALESIKTAAARIETASQHVERAAANIEQASVGAKAAVGNIEGASQDVKGMTSRAATAVRKATGGRPTLPTVRGAVDLQYLPRPGQWWAEANVDIGSGDRMLRLGATDIGEHTGLNLQLGRGGLRAGIVQSKLGIGYDRRLGRLGLSLDLYDPNRLKGNLLLEQPLGDRYALVGGLRNAFDDEETTGAIGLRVGR